MYDRRNLPEAAFRPEVDGGGRGHNKMPTPVQILVAEDNPADVYLIRQALNEHGVVYEAKVVTDGKTALSVVRRTGEHASTPRPDLVLLDLNLPQHDGIEILQAIRQDPFWATVTVVILTSSDSPKDRELADELGADRYVRKPSNLSDFLSIGGVLKDLLAVRRDGTA